MKTKPDPLGKISPPRQQQGSGSSIRSLRQGARGKPKDPTDVHRLFPQVPALTRMTHSRCKMATTHAVPRSISEATASEDAGAVSRGALPAVRGHRRHGLFAVSAPEGIRTPNLLIRSQMLYPLSYGRLLFSCTARRRSAAAEARGFEPPVRFKTDNSLAVSPIRPLWHASRTIRGHSVHSQSS